MFEKELAYVEERRLAIAERRAQASPTHRPLLPTPPPQRLSSPNADPPSAPPPLVHRQAAARLRAAALKVMADPSRAPTEPAARFRAAVRKVVSIQRIARVAEAPPETAVRPALERAQTVGGSTGKAKNRRHRSFTSDALGFKRPSSGRWACSERCSNDE